MSGSWLNEGPFIALSQVTSASRTATTMISIQEWYQELTLTSAPSKIKKRIRRGKKELGTGSAKLADRGCGEWNKVSGYENIVLGGGLALVPFTCAELGFPGSSVHCSCTGGGWVWVAGWVGPACGVGSWPGVCPPRISKGRTHRCCRWAAVVSVIIVVFWAILVNIIVAVVGCIYRCRWHCHWGRHPVTLVVVIVGVYYSSMSGCACQWQQFCSFGVRCWDWGRGRISRMNEEVRAKRTTTHPLASQSPHSSFSLPKILQCVPNQGGSGDGGGRKLARIPKERGGAHVGGRLWLDGS